MKVIVSAVCLTADDYARSGCDAALAACPRRYKSDYESAIAEHVRAFQETGNEKAVAVSSIILAILSMREPWSQARIPDEDDPYWPTYAFDESACTYSSFLLGLVPKADPVIADAEVRARAAELLYQRSIAAGGKRDFHAAKLAAESYLAEATWQERHCESWHQAGYRVARAFDIAAELKNGPLRETVVGHIDNALALYSVPKDTSSVDAEPAPCQEPSRYPALLMKLLLQHFRKGDSVAHVTLAERLAQEALEAKAWDAAREYLGVAARWYEKAGDTRSEVAIMERAAELWVQEGEYMVTASETHAVHIQFAMAENRLLSGIHALKGVRGMAKARRLAAEEVSRLDTRIEEVRGLHQHYQEHGAVKAVSPIHTSGEFDLTEVLAIVEGKEKMGALFAMTHFPLPTRIYVEEMVKEEQEKYVLSRFFGLVLMDERGRTTARADGDDIWARTCQRAVMLYELRAQLLIGPHLWKIGMDHAVDLTDFFLIAQASQFVPAGREQQYARGLYEGFKGDFALALHLLIPQVENSIRLILRSVAASSEQPHLDCAEVLSNPEHPFLTQSLYEPWALELVQVLGDGGEDVVFALRILLVERFGANLRNSVLHGLLPYGGVQNWRCWYLWWLILKVCFSTIRVARQDDE